MIDINFDRGFLSKLIETGDMSTIKESQIKPHFIIDNTTREAFKYIQEQFTDSGSVPTERILLKRFPNLKLEKYRPEESNEESLRIVGTKEPLKYWCTELRKRAKHDTLVDTIEEVASILDGLKTEEAFSLLKKSIIKVETEIEETTMVDITEDTDSRKSEYLKRKENKGMIGIPTGIKTLDYIIKGLQKKQLITLLANTAVGKANPLTTPILTPKGFKLMKDIKVNDLVIGEDGKPYPVTAIYPQGIKEVYELTFSDGTKSRCCKEHLWKFTTQDDRSRKKGYRVDTLENIMKLPLRRGKLFNLAIPVNKPVEFESKSDLPLDPYVLGCLLGDGGFTTDRISFTTVELDILSKLQDKLKNWGEFTKSGDKIQYTFKSHNSRSNKLFRTIRKLHLQGLKSNDKFIPKDYLHASIEDRMELLKGLFDTDGHVSKDGVFSISTISKSLVFDINYLCRSLGYRTTTLTLDRTHENKGIEYRVTISTDDIIFSSNKHLTRYESVVKPSKKHYHNQLKITNIELVSEEECQCISVGSTDHTYLCDDFIVTHNTWIEIIIGAYAMTQGYNVLQITTEMSEEQMRDRYEAVLYGLLKGGFNYGRFKAGTLTPEEEDGYFDFLDNILPTLPPLYIEGGESPSKVLARAQSLECDLVLVDGVYLLSDDHNSDADWLRVANITRDMKKGAKALNIPIFINTQADNNTSKKTGPELDNIAFARAIGHESDVVLGLFRDEQMREDKEAMLKVLKQREGILGKIYLNWDFNKMNFSCIYGLTESGDSITDPSTASDTSSSTTSYKLKE